MTRSPEASPDLFPQPCELIEVRVGDLRQLFNSIDPSPFREQDLDPEAEEFIVSWAREARRDVPLALLIHVERPRGSSDDHTLSQDAVHEYFRGRARATRVRLRHVFHLGRISLLIGIVCLALSVVLGSAIEGWLAGRRLGELLRESVLIGGWVAMWKPLETFLYDWWPILADARLFDRLSAMPVRVVYPTSE